MIALMLLAIFVLYSLAAFFITRWLVKRATSKKAKWVVGTLSALVFFLIPTGDEIVGQVYLNYLCKTEGGAQVYQSVELGSEYWRTDGTPKFIKENGDVDEDVLKPRFEFKSERDRDYIGSLNIARIRHSVLDAESRGSIGSYTSFGHFGGWLVNNIGMHVKAQACPNVRSRNYRTFLQQLFVHK